MKATSWYFACGVTLSLWVATAAGFDEYLARATDSGVIRIRGSLPLADSVERLAKWFAKEHPGSAANVSGGGMKAAFEGLSDNLTDIVMAARRARPSETADAVRKGIHLEERLIGSAAMTVFVSTALPVQELTLEQLRKIYKGKIDRWSDVGGPDALIQSFSLRDAPRGPAGWFRSHVMESAEFGPRTEFCGEPVQLVKHVAAATAGIGYMGSIVLGELLKSNKDLQIRVIKLAADSQTVAVLPTPQNIRDSAYPLSRSLYFYWNATTDNRDVPAFVDYCTKRAAHLQ